MSAYTRKHQIMAFGVILVVIVVLIFMLVGSNRQNTDTRLAARAAVNLNPTIVPSPNATIQATSTLPPIIKRIIYIIVENTPEPITIPSQPPASTTITVTQGQTLSPSATTPPTIIHTVQRGESLYAIARFYNVSEDTIITANNLANPNRLDVGQTLVIPQGEVVTTPIAPVTPPTPTPAQSVAINIEQPEINGIPSAINNVPLGSLIHLPEDTRLHVREIYAHGQSLGRNPNAFSKLGDSTIENPHFLARFDDTDYKLGDYAALQPIIDRFSGSFSRNSVAVQRGLHSWSVFDPMWASRSGCASGENVLSCEIRLSNPSLIFIRLGSNDVGVPDSFDRNLRRVVEYCIENGVIPLLGTKADRREGGDNTNNNIIRQIAADYNVPLWDFDVLAGTLPSRGLGGDGVHMTTFFANDYTQPAAFQTGYGVHNLLALLTLDAVTKDITENPLQTPLIDSTYTVISEETAQNIREIYAYGQKLGNDPRSFSKIGDSITASYAFMHPFGMGAVNLDAYSHLQVIIDYFTLMNTHNPFTRESQAAAVGWAAMAVFDPNMANPSCLPGEAPILCEYRQNKPAFAFVMFGTNDIGYRSVEQYRADLTRIVTISETMGVIPILSTIPNRPEQPQNITTFNTVVRDVATAQRVPLWDYNAALQDLPNWGLYSDNLHPSMPPGEFEDAADFSPFNLRYGYTVRNLTALQTLFHVLTCLQGETMTC